MRLEMLDCTSGLSSGVGWGYRHITQLRDPPCRRACVLLFHPLHRPIAVHTIVLWFHAHTGSARLPRHHQCCRHQPRRPCREQVPPASPRRAPTCQAGRAANALICRRTISGSALLSAGVCNAARTDMSTFAEFNEAYVAAFGDHRPARSTIGVAALPLNGAVEIEAWAYLPE